MCAQQVEQVFEGGNGVGSGHSDASEIVPGPLAQRASGVSDPIQDRVVKDHQPAVGGRLHVCFQVAVTLVDRPGEGRHRVLATGEIVEVPAPVGERPRARQIQEGTHSAAGRPGPGTAASLARPVGTTPPARTGRMGR